MITLRTQQVIVELYWDEGFRDYCRQSGMRIVQQQLNKALGQLRSTGYDPDFPEYQSSFTVTVMPYGGWINNDARGSIYLERKRHIMLKALESIRG